jgi:hypothetical protein
VNVFELSAQDELQVTGEMMLIELSVTHRPISAGEATCMQTAIVDDVEIGTEVSAISLAPIDI